MWPLKWIFIAVVFGLGLTAGPERDRHGFGLMWLMCLELITIGLALRDVFLLNTRTESKLQTRFRLASLALLAAGTVILGLQITKFMAYQHSLPEQSERR